MPTRTPEPIASPICKQIHLLQRFSLEGDDEQTIALNIVRALIERICLENGEAQKKPAEATTALELLEKETEKAAGEKIELDSPTKEGIVEAKEPDEPKESEPKDEPASTEDTKSQDTVRYRLPMLEKLLSLLSTKDQINPVLSGYFVKVMDVLMERKQLDMLGYLFGFREHVQNLLRHCYDKSIADVLKKVVSNEDKYLSGTTGDEYLPEKMEVISQLVDQMESTNSAPVITNSAGLLAGLIDGRQHLGYFNEERVLKRVFSTMVSENPASTCACITYITALLKLNSAAATTSDQFCFIGVDTLQRKPSANYHI